MLTGRASKDLCVIETPSKKTAGEKRWLWYKFCRTSCWLVARVFFRYKAFGQENVPCDGGVLIASNHQSFLDPALIAMGLSRPVHFMARESLFRKATFGRLIASLNAFPVKRMGRDIRAVKEAIRRLQAEQVVMLFPEGTRTETGEIGPLQPGLGWIAAKAGTPIVPAVINGAFEAWPRNKKLVRPHSIRVAFGEPITPGEEASFTSAATGGKSERESYEAVSELVREKMIDLQRQLKSLAQGQTDNHGVITN